MKQIFIVSSCFLLAISGSSQVKEGKIIFERIFQFQVQLADNNPAMQNMIPRERKDRFELLFANNKSLWRPVEDESQGDEINLAVRMAAQE